jgi:F-type H+-transporting ATPase subunit b
MTARGPSQHARTGSLLIRRLSMAVMLTVGLVSQLSAVTSQAADPGHTATSEAGHHDDAHEHGDHHSEIGTNPPPGVSRETFESPAEFRGDLAIWSFVVFLLLMGLLSAVAWKPIMEGLEKREQGIADTIAATQAASDDAKKLLASYERRLAEASEEVKAMLDEARRDADNLRQSIVSEARQAADEEKQRAHREIGMARDEAIAQLAETAGDLAVSVAGKFLREKISAEEQQRLVQESVASLKAAPSIN